MPATNSAEKLCGPWLQGSLAESSGISLYAFGPWFPLPKQIYNYIAFYLPSYWHLNCKSNLRKLRQWQPHLSIVLGFLSDPQRKPTFTVRHVRTTSVLPFQTHYGKKNTTQVFRSPRIYADLSISSWLEDSRGLCCSQTAEAVGGLRGALVNACFPFALSSALLHGAKEFVYPYHTPQEGIDMLHSLSISLGLFKPLFL